MRRFCGTRGWQAILNFKRMLHMKQELLCCAVLALLGAFACLPALRSARPGAKLTQLYRLPKDSAIPFFDLSGDSLTELPDLSRYRIDSLDLLHNCIDTFILERLPRDIEWLDLSYNRLGGTFYYGCLLEVQGGGLFARQDLKWANLSHNPIERVDYARAAGCQWHRAGTSSSIWFTRSGGAGGSFWKCPPTAWSTSCKGCLADARCAWGVRGNLTSRFPSPTECRLELARQFFPERVSCGFSLVPAGRMAVCAVSLPMAERASPRHTSDACSGHGASCSRQVWEAASAARLCGVGFVRAPCPRRSRSQPAPYTPLACTVSKGVPVPLHSRFLPPSRRLLCEQVHRLFCKNFPILCRIGRPAREKERKMLKFV